MAEVLACDVCGAVSPPGELPPSVFPARWQNAIEDYAGALCVNCAATRTLAEIIATFHGTPGGVVSGADRGPYLVVMPGK